MVKLLKNANFFLKKNAKRKMRKEKCEKKNAKRKMRKEKCEKKNAKRKMEEKCIFLFAFFFHFSSIYKCHFSLM